MTNIKKVFDKDLELKFEISVSVDELKQEIEKEAEKQQKTLKIDGFRKGKVPLSVIKNKYSALILSESAENLVENTINKIIDENKYALISRPKIEIKTLELDKDFEFTATLELYPEIPAIDYKKMKLEKEKVEMSDKEIEESQKRILKNFLQWVEQENSYEAEKGDKVNINFLGKVDGKPFDGGKAENYDLELGSKSFIDTFEDQLIGAKTGDEITVKVSFPENYHSKELAGKPATFDVKINSVSTPGEQEVNDEFIKKNLNIESLEKFHEMIKKELTSIYERSSKNKIKNAIFEWLKKNVEIELPKTIVDEEFNRQWEEVERDLSKNPDNFKDEKEKEEEKDKIRKEAEESIKLGLILSQIGKENNIQVQETEIIEEIRKRAASMPGQEQMFVDFYLKNKSALNQITGSILEDKVIDFIADKADTKEVVVSVEDLKKE